MYKSFKDFEWKTVISVPEAAHCLGVGRKVIYQLIDFGELGSTRHRGMILIEEDSVVAFGESGELT